MILKDLNLAIRNIQRNKVESSISILGLGLGLGSIIVLMALIVHETSFDRYFNDYQDVYRITWGTGCQTAYPLADAMKKDFPEVRDYFRINQANNVQVRNLKGESGSIGKDPERHRFIRE
jgi:putative ABC transport system permease protein